VAGVTPNEGENYVAGKVYINGNLKVGLWKGSWNLQETVVYTQADAVFTKIVSDGFAEVLLSSWSIVNDIATHPDVVFTAGVGVSETINGYYIVTEDNRLLHIERAPAPLVRTEGQGYRVVLSNVVA